MHFGRSGEQRAAPRARRRTQQLIPPRGSTLFGAFVLEALHGLDAFRQGFEQRAAPATRGEWRDLLIGLFVGLSEEAHGLVPGSRVLFHGNLEFDFSVRLADRKSTRLNSSHIQKSRMPSSA